MVRILRVPIERGVGMVGPDLARAGIFTAAEAAALLGVSASKIRAWVSGWPGSSTAPVVENDIGWMDNKLAFSFANLMEIRFIAFFENAGVRLPEIRRIMDEVRNEINRPRPFATNLVFKTDGERIVAEVATKSGIKSIYDLKSRNFEMREIVYRSLKDDVVYDPKGDARAWFPRKQIAPNVIIHPSVAFGRPVLKEQWIPTETIADAWQAEESIDMVARLFQIPEARVKEAVSFEQNIGRAA